MKNSEVFEIVCEKYKLYSTKLLKKFYLIKKETLRKKTILRFKYL